MAFDQIKYINEFNKDKYDAITFRIPKGRKEDVKAVAKAEGKSLNEIIVFALEKTYGINLSN